MIDTDPLQPTTAIPELFAVPLSNEECDVVAAAANTVHDRLVDRLRHKEGASLRGRIDLVAAILVGAFDHGRDAAVETRRMEPDAAMALVADLATRRAMETWHHGGV